LLTQFYDRKKEKDPKKRKAFGDPWAQCMSPERVVKLQRNKNNPLAGWGKRYPYIKFREEITSLSKRLGIEGAVKHHEEVIRKGLSRSSRLSAKTSRWWRLP